MSEIGLFATKLTEAAKVGNITTARKILETSRDRGSLLDVLFTNFTYTRHNCVNLLVLNAHFSIAKATLDTVNEFGILSDVLLTSDWDYSRTQDFTLVHRSSCIGSTAVVKYILQLAQDNALVKEVLTSRTTAGITPLHCASLYGNIEALDQIVYFAEKNGLIKDVLLVRNNFEESSFFVSGKCKSSSSNVRTSTMMRILDVAKDNGLLLNLLQEKCTPREGGLTPLLCAVEENNTVVLVKILKLVQSNSLLGEVLCSHRPNELSVFYYSSIKGVGDGAILKQLFEAAAHQKGLVRDVLLAKVGPVLNIFSLLSCAAYQRDHPAVISVILDAASEHGMLKEVLLPDYEKFMTTPLHLAATKGNTENVRMLINFARKNHLLHDVFTAEDRSDGALSGVAPIHHAAINGRLETFEELLRVAQDNRLIHFCLQCTNDSKRNNLLHLAAGNGHIQITSAILDFACRNTLLAELLLTKNEDGVNAFYLAIIHAKIATATEIIKKGLISCDFVIKEMIRQGKTLPTRHLLGSIQRKYTQSCKVDDINEYRIDIPGDGESHLQLQYNTERLGDLTKFMMSYDPVWERQDRDFLGMLVEHGMSDPLRQWVKKALTKRFLLVPSKSSRYKPDSTTTGQGTVFAPHFFSYFADLAAVINKSVVVFADDAMYDRAAGKLSDWELYQRYLSSYTGQAPEPL